MAELDVEQRRAVEEGLSEDELALFDILKKDDLGRTATGKGETVKSSPFGCDQGATHRGRPFLGEGADQG